MAQKHQYAEIYFQNKFVGALGYVTNDLIATFEYSPEWRQSGIELSPIKMPLSATKYRFPQLPFPTFRGLPGCFADALPDDFGNAVINAWLARQQRSPDSFSAIERLLYTGKRAMGAFEFKPAIQRYNKVSKLELDALIEMAQAVFNQRNDWSAQLDEQSDEALQQILQVGTSAGGARAKAVIAMDPLRQQIVSGQGNVPDEFEHFVIKFDGVVQTDSHRETFGDPFGFGRMEYAYYLMAVEAGIEMMPSELLIQGELAHFLTKRFDRDKQQKIHYQSLCALTHVDYKQPGLYSYEQLFGLLRKLKLKRKEALELFRRMTFNVIMRNQDDHTKNFGFIMSDSGQYQLAPAFDVAFSYKPGSPWVAQHQMSINGKRDHFLKEDLLAVVPPSLKSDGLQIIEEVLDIAVQWPTFAERAGVFPELQQFIGESLRLKL